MNGFRRVVLMLLSVAAVLLAASRLPGGTIYHLEGMFPPSFVQQQPTTFRGTLDFPGETVDAGTLKLEIDAEQPLVREIPFVLGTTVLGSGTQPWDQRSWYGTEEPLLMLATDFGMQAGQTDSSAGLDDGGGWDSWIVSLPQFPAGVMSYLSQTPQVNEPTAMALAVVGFVVVFGVAREAQRHR